MYTAASSSSSSIVWTYHIHAAVSNATELTRAASFSSDVAGNDVNRGCCMHGVPVGQHTSSNQIVTRR